MMTSGVYNDDTSLVPRLHSPRGVWSGPDYTPHGGCGLGQTMMTLTEQLEPCSISLYPPVFDRLKYANMEGEGLGDVVIAVTSDRKRVYVQGRCLTRSSLLLASFSVTRPAFCCLQYGKAGRAWYVSSRECRQG